MNLKNEPHLSESVLSKLISATLHDVWLLQGKGKGAIDGLRMNKIGIAASARK